MGSTHSIFRHMGGVTVGGSGLGLEQCGGKVYWVDPTNGGTGDDALTPESANSSLLTVYNKTADGRHNIVKFIPGATSWSPAVELTWSNSYTHLEGLSTQWGGLWPRCGVSGSTSADLTSLATFSGSSCVIAGIRFWNGADADADTGCLTVSGSRNRFIGCMFNGFGHATPAARAGSYTMSLTGSENVFENCIFGCTTVLRAAANYQVTVTGVRNHFINCWFLSYSETAGAFMVKIDNSAGDLDYTYFEGCNFHNKSANWATSLTDCFDLPAAGATYNVLMGPGNNLMGGITGWADTVTRMRGVEAAPNAGWGISIAPTA